jgi:DNA-binding NtrC family response regulator
VSSGGEIAAQQYVAQILLVEPDADLRTTQAVALGSAGHRVQATGSFDDARRALAEGLPDVLITAVRLGAFNGLHLIIRARALRPRVAAILTATAADPALDAEARANGAIVVLAGSDPSSLERLVNSVAGTPQP